MQEKKILNSFLLLFKEVKEKSKYAYHYTVKKNNEEVKEFIITLNKFLFKYLKLQKKKENILNQKV